MTTDEMAMERVALGRVAYARSGDKGTSANVGVIARNDRIFESLREQLTTDRVLDHFRALGASEVDRFELPNLRALNFVIKGVLGRITRVDAQGKALGQAMLEMPVRMPADLVPVD